MATLVFLEVDKIKPVTFTEETRTQFLKVMKKHDQ